MNTPIEPKRGDYYHYRDAIEAIRAGTATEDNILHNHAVISMTQPWAWLVVQGWKPIENRDKNLRLMGRLLIHASAACRAPDEFDCRKFVEGFAPDLAEKIPYPLNRDQGGIVGVVTVTDWVQTSASPWFTGPWGAVLADAQPLPFLPCKGAPGIWRLNALDPSKPMWGFSSRSKVA